MEKTMLRDMLSLIMYRIDTENMSEYHQEQLLDSADLILARLSDIESDDAADIIISTVDLRTDAERRAEKSLQEYKNLKKNLV
jgi:hypothetical protein